MKGSLILLLLAIVGLLVVSYGGAAFEKGEFFAPFDDAYIHYQYAFQASRGLFWQYNDIDPPTTGATSLVYPFLLAFGILMGISKANVPLLGMAIGSAAFLLSTYFVFDLSSSILSEMDQKRPVIFPAFTIALLFALSPGVQWGFFNGMETALFATAILLAARACLKGDYLKLAWFAVLSAFIRPEGTFLAFVVGLTFLYDFAREPNSDEFKKLLKYFFILILATGPILINLFVTGDISATGAQAKSWFGNVPYRAGDIVDSVFNEAIRIVSRLSFGPFASDPWSILPGVLPFALVAVVLLFRQDRRYGRFVFLTSVWVVLGILLSSTLITSVWHVGRYQMPYLGLLYPLAGLGFWYIYFRFSFLGQFVFLSAVGFLLTGFLMYSTYQNIQLYRQAAQSMRALQIATGRWIDNNLPPDARVAMLDAGAIRYYGNRYTIDIIGLTSADFAHQWRSGPGAIFEQMSNLENRPTHIVVFPNVSTIPYFERTDVFSQEVQSITAENYSNLGAVESTKVIYEIDWDQNELSGRPNESHSQNLTKNLNSALVIDVADFRSEQQSNFSWWEGDLKIGHATEFFQFQELVPAQSIMDGGRLITGGLAFDVNYDQGQSGYTIVARTHNIEPNQFIVYANDIFVGEWHLSTAPGSWVESSFLFPEEFLIAGANRIRLEVSNLDSPIGIYHFWGYSGKPVFEITQFEHIVDARFDQGVQFLGFNLKNDQGVFDLEVGWQKTEPNDLDAKVFFHVYDQNGNIVYQRDGYASDSDRPPFAWHVGETIIDRYRIENLEDVTGDIQLAIGLYDAITGQRVSISNSLGYETSDERLFLTKIDVD
ncbi:MAG: hypothetical protein AAF902_20345 [Chloroflexota bacterium]